MHDITASLRDLRIVFAGTPEFAARHLQALLDHHLRVVAVYCQPDRPAGRGKHLAVGPVKQLALDHRLPIHQPAGLKSAEAAAELAALAPDIVVVVAYGLLLPQKILDIPRLGCINVHASLLPRWRGAAPIQRAIEAGDPQTGVTIMRMEAGLDTGPMLLSATCPITAMDTAATLQEKLATQGVEALITALQQIADGVTNPLPQDDRHATYAGKINKSDAQLDWHQDARALERRVRAFNPVPVAFALLANEPVRIWAATASDETSDQPPGTIVAAHADGITIACARGQLVVTELQLPGKKKLPAADLLNSRAAQFRPGLKFQSRDN